MGLSPVLGCVGAKLPLYAFKKLNNTLGDKGFPRHENQEAPVAFLDSLILGEVKLFIEFEEILTSVFYRLVTSIMG